MSFGETFVILMAIFIIGIYVGIRIERKESQRVGWRYQKGGGYGRKVK